jgi:hypothetical protein
LRCQQLLQQLHILRLTSFCRAAGTKTAKTGKISAENLLSGSELHTGVTASVMCS